MLEGNAVNIMFSVSDFCHYVEIILYCEKGGKIFWLHLYKDLDPSSVPLTDCTWVTIPFEWQWHFVITMLTFIATVVPQEHRGYIELVAIYL